MLETPGDSLVLLHSFGGAESCINTNVDLGSERELIFKILKAICMLAQCIEAFGKKGCADTRVGTRGGARELLHIHGEG